MGVSIGSGAEGLSAGELDTVCPELPWELTEGVSDDNRIEVRFASIICYPF